MRAPCGRPLSLLGPETQQTYAALAILSDCYSPPEGRLSTCYAPVRRFTQGLPLFLARLACVKPAANVRSEPGSNSPIKVFDLLASPIRVCFRIHFMGVEWFLFVRFFLSHSRYSVFKDQPNFKLKKLCFESATTCYRVSDSSYLLRLVNNFFSDFFNFFPDPLSRLSGLAFATAAPLEPFCCATGNALYGFLLGGQGIFLSDLAFLSAPGMNPGGLCIVLRSAHAGVWRTL